jgi:hypothetical protein
MTPQFNLLIVAAEEWCDQAIKLRTELDRAAAAKKVRMKPPPRHQMLLQLYGMPKCLAACRT